MKKYTSGLDIKKKILKALKDKPTSLRKLETHLDIGYNSIKRHSKELEYFGFIKITKTSKDSRNGRPYSLAELTSEGKKV